MSEQQEFVEIEPGELMGLAAQMKADGWRFVQCHAMRGRAEGTLDVMYSFADDAALELRSYVLHLDAPATEGTGEVAKPDAQVEADGEPEAPAAEDADEPAPAGQAPAAAQAPSVPSLGELFPGAFMFENEMHDLYGIEVTGMTLDYRGGFYHLHIPHPMADAPAAPAKKTPAARPQTR